ncbi:MAG: DUF839 domain-containing protein, partial [Planctomycetes bacterium]|nr:DUF839 domain-containing protein [Planctomycetota bacterium]
MRSSITLTLAVTALTAGVLSAQDAAMIRGLGWRTEALFTFGSTVGNFTPTGVPDGTGLFPARDARALLLVNSELGEGAGYAYKLANGTELVGARVHGFLISRQPGRGAVVHAVNVAYDTVYDRQGAIVTDPKQINETGTGKNGFARFCSATGVQAGSYGFVDDILFANEEGRRPLLQHGGTVWALDVRNRALWACPMLGRGAWENVTPLAADDHNTVALLLGADTIGSPMFLYVGTKSARGTFLERNGLANGKMYVWVADNGDSTPDQFNTVGSTRTGKFVEIAVRDTAKAGQPGYDSVGYLDDDTLRIYATGTLKAFQFSRPEDLHVNPRNGTQVVFASTGHGQQYPKDNWGTLYIIDVTLAPTGHTGKFEIVHDADGLPAPDLGIRSPDNVVWAHDGYIYVQEDRSTSLFGAVSKMDASVWQLDPATKAYTRIGVANTSV